MSERDVTALLIGLGSVLSYFSLRVTREPFIYFMSWVVLLTDAYIALTLLLETFK